MQNTGTTGLIQSSTSSLKGNPMVEIDTQDFFTSYLKYAGHGESEAPAVYHRWTCTSVISALLGRQVYFPFGHQHIYPNQYILLMGTPAARKGTAMGVGKTLAKAAGYSRFGSDKTSKERFLMDMKQYEDANAIEDLEALTLDEPSETYIVAGEFVDFIGINNIEFTNLLTNLWDNLAVYKNPKIVGKSVEVQKPTVNIIGGATAQTFALAIPAESNGTGFLSRLLLIHGEPTGIQVAWPMACDEMQTEIMGSHLRTMREEVKGEMSMDNKGRALGARIYKEYVDIEDGRFQHYKGRRFVHFIKLAMCIAAVDLSMKITEEHMLKANTMLAAAETRMPSALGGFGKDPNSDIKNKILDHLAHTNTPQDFNRLYKLVANDVRKSSDLADILSGLKTAEKVSVVTIKGKQGYVLNHVEHKKWASDLLVPEWLTEEERIVLL